MSTTQRTGTFTTRGLTVVFGVLQIGIAILAGAFGATGFADRLAVVFTSRDCARRFVAGWARNDEVQRLDEIGLLSRLMVGVSSVEPIRGSMQ